MQAPFRLYAALRRRRVTCILAWRESGAVSPLDRLHRPVCTVLLEDLADFQQDSRWAIAQAVLKVIRAKDLRMCAVRSMIRSKQIPDLIAARLHSLQVRNR